MPEDQPDLRGASVSLHQALLSSEQAMDGIWEGGCHKEGLNSLDTNLQQDHQGGIST